MPDIKPFTGRSFVTFLEGPAELHQERFNRLMAHLQPLAPFVPAGGNFYPNPDNEGHLYQEWGVAIIPYSPEVVAPLIGDAKFGLQTVEPERYLRATSAVIASAPPPATPGLVLTRASISTATGAAVRMAILDTGFEFRHSDFPSTRFVATKSFTGDPVQDSVNGHGTHVTGTAGGPLTSAGAGRRYGIAHQASLYIARVLDPAGFGFDQWVLDAVQWARSFDVHIILMCLGIPAPGSNAGMERVAKDALANGTLLIAAGGNSNNNTSTMPPDPVEYPANCPSIFAVAAVDNDCYVPAYCNGGLPGSGGEINVAAPGEYVYSSTRVIIPSLTPPVPPIPQFGFASGSSMAAAHVAGLAALWCNGGTVRGDALWNLIETNAIPKAMIGPYFSGKLAVAP